MQTGYSQFSSRSAFVTDVAHTSPTGYEQRFKSRDAPTRAKTATSTKNATVAENNARHRTPAVQAWLTRRRRATMHFTPTGTSWGNLIERLYSKVTNERIVRGASMSVQEQEAAVDAWFEDDNEIAKAFAWTRNADKIIRNVLNYRPIYDALH